MCHRLTVAILSMTMIALGLSAPANASSINGVHVLYYIPNNAGNLTIYVDTPRTGAPACVTSTPIVWSVDVTTPGGQAMASALLTAMASGMYVDIAGTGTCEYAGVESIGYLSIHH